MPTNQFAGLDIIDVRDVIARFEEIEGTLSDMSDADREADNVSPTDTISDAYHDLHCEFLELQSLLESLKGCGGDEQWRGDWYPLTLIAGGHFVSYCQELVEDIGDVPKELPSYIVVDWEATAENIKADYSEVDFGGYTYFYR